MRDLRKASEMALEALEIATTYLPVKTATLNEVEKAMQALRQALAQPKREWVGLTDEEIGTLTVFDGLHHVETPLLADFARAVEAKLKEKNSG